MDSLTADPAVRATEAHIVVATRGEYSDREVWIAGVFPDRPSAMRHRGNLMAETAAYRRDRTVWAGRRDVLRRKLAVDYPTTHGAVCCDWWSRLSTEHRNEIDREITKLIGESPEIEGEMDDCTVVSCAAGVPGAWSI